MTRSPKGNICPLCKTKDVTSVGRYHPLPGVRIRYYRCNICKAGPRGGATRFKTIERPAGVIGGKTTMQNFVPVPSVPNR